MKKSKFTESLITKALKEYEGGRSVEDICRELVVKPPTFYVWKRKHSTKDHEKRFSTKRLSKN
jgi:putative transposase